MTDVPTDATGIVRDTADVLADVWDDATNAVCQAMQDAAMCLCPDGRCIAASVRFPASIYEAGR